MTGVEILSQTDIYKTEGYPWIIGIFLCVGLLAGVIGAIVEAQSFGFSDITFPIVLIGFLLGLAIGLTGFALTLHESDTADYTEYKVIIDDSVSMNEFLDKYEILDQEGKIYTVKERE